MADTPAFRLTADAADTGSRAASRSESLIDRESHFTGTYRTPHDMRIEGRYEGEIECQGTVFVGETANVNARIVAGNVTVAGHCQGELVCDTRFEILRTGRVSGSVTASVTVVHEGAFYDGELRMTRRTGAEAGRRELGTPAATRTPQPPPSPRPPLSEPPPPLSEPALPPRPAAAAPGPDRTASPPPRRRPADTPPASAEPDMPASLAVSGARTNGIGNGSTPAPRPDGPAIPSGDA